MKGPRARRERRLALGLGIALAILLAGIALILRHDARPTDGSVPARSADVSHLTIERPGRPDIALERIAGDWRVTSPCALDADDGRVTPLLEALADTTLSYPAGEVDLEAAGLLEPLATVRLDELSVKLGATDLGGERRYAQRGRTVMLVPEWTLSLANGGLSALARLALLDEAPTALRRVALPDDSLDMPSGALPGAAPDRAPETTPEATPDTAPWGTLTASQIVPWPVPDAPPATRRTRLEAVFASGATRRLDLEGNARWTSIRIDDGACAHIVGNAALPADTYP